MRDVFEFAVAPDHHESTKKILGSAAAFDEFVAYVAKFQDHGGPYTPANRKFVLSKAGAAEVRALLKAYVDASVIHRLAPAAAEEIIQLMTSPTYEVKHHPELPGGADLAQCGGAMYGKGITGAQVKRALAAGLVIDLNCRIVRDVKGPGGLSCQRQTVFTPGPVGRALLRVVGELRRAKSYAALELQKKQIEHTINFLNSGEVEQFRQANIAWVRLGSEARVDFMMGFVEVYGDYNGKIGTWESYIQIVDPEITRATVKLARSAQYFEDKMPYGKWKKRFDPGYAPPALMAYYFQEIADMRSSGYNLPNFDDIRRDVGFKNVIRLDMPGADKDPAERRVFEEAFKEFMPASLVARALEHRARARRLVTLLHEIIGHGSGTYDRTKYGATEDPISALGAAGGSVLEEQRADLAALSFFNDPKMVEIGIFKNAAEADLLRNVAYDMYLGTSLLRLSRERSIAEAHSRGHWLFINRLLAAGAARWVARDDSASVTDDNRVLAVVDYAKMQAESVKLLAELQTLKALRNEAGLRSLLATRAPLDEVGQPWAQAVIRRGEGLLYNAGAVEQPWGILEEEHEGTLRLETRGGTSLLSVAPFWFQ